ncbi:MAG: hypothetical protein R3275_01940 [Saprospiraceae bacterium]|nr:hypothetical protein [Saprospiraceae bacterium]
MTINISDQADLSNRLIRRIKFLLYKLKEKFQQIIYTDVHIGTEGHSPTSFTMSIVVGLPGQSVVFTMQEEEPESLIKGSYLKLKRILSKRLGRNSQN